MVVDDATMNFACQLLMLHRVELFEGLGQEVDLMGLGGQGVKGDGTSPSWSCPASIRVPRAC